MDKITGAGEFIVLGQVRSVTYAGEDLGRRVIAHAEPFANHNGGLATSRLPSAALDYFRTLDDRLKLSQDQRFNPRWLALNQPSLIPTQIDYEGMFNPDALPLVEWHIAMEYRAKCLWGYAARFSKDLDIPVTVLPVEFSSVDAFRSRLERILPGLQKNGGDVAQLIWYEQAKRSHREAVLEAMRKDRGKPLYERVNTSVALSTFYDVFPSQSDVRKELGLFALMGAEDCVTEIFEQF